MRTTAIVVEYEGTVPYTPIYHAMQAFTERRDLQTPDQFWVLQHSPVYTLGKAGKSEHVLNSGTIPVQKIDRGGQVTYHGPGQLVVYLLLDLKRQNLFIKAFVERLEAALIDLLMQYDIQGHRQAGAPGVYVDGKKVAALGLRVRRGCSYHGISLNIDMDLSPFDGINPCGYSGLTVTQLRDLGVKAGFGEIKTNLISHLMAQLYKAKG